MNLLGRKAGNHLCDVTSNDIQFKIYSRLQGLIRAFPPSNQLIQLPFLTWAPIKFLNEKPEPGGKIIFFLMSGHWGQGEEEFQKKNQSQVFIKGRVEDPRNEFEDEGQVVSRSRYTPQAHRLQNWSKPQLRKETSHIHSDRTGTTGTRLFVYFKPRLRARLPTHRFRSLRWKNYKVP